MRIHLAANTTTYFSPIVAVLYQNYIEIERVTAIWPGEAKWSFNQPYGKYNIRCYASKDGCALNYLLSDFWIDHKYKGKMPRILKDRK